MYKLSLIFQILFCLQINAQIKDSAIYLCKYNFSWQKDSTDINSKFNDIMCLQIGKKSSVWYSYLRQVGFRNLEEDQAKKVTPEYAMQHSGRYFGTCESEIIMHNFETRTVKVSDLIVESFYVYIEKIEAPVWKIKSDTATILRQVCQKATTFYKGRNYIAWFAPDIPLHAGPWLFQGLPGLILKITDTKSQFIFTCTELTTKVKGKSIFKEYVNTKEISKKRLRELKRLKTVDFFTLMKMESPNLTVTSRDKNGSVVPIEKILLPYNPLDLSK